MKKILRAIAAISILFSVTVANAWGPNNFLSGNQGAGNLSANSLTLTTPLGTVSGGTGNSIGDTPTAEGLYGVLYNPKNYGTAATCTGYYQIATHSLNAGGSGYAANDTFYIINSSFGGGSNDAYGIVDTVDGSGAVLTYHLTTNGGGYYTGTGISTVKTSGSGSGLKINIDSIGTGTDDTAAFTAAANAAVLGGGALLVPHGCWITAPWTAPKHLNMVGFQFGPTYGYFQAQKPQLGLIGGSASLGIATPYAGNSFTGFEVRAHEGGAFGNTACIGTDTGNYNGGDAGLKTQLHFMSMKGCKVGFGSSWGSGSYIFADVYNSDFGANNYGMYGTFSDLTLENSVFVSGVYGLYQLNGGGYMRISNNRAEYLEHCYRLGYGGSESSFIGNQCDRADYAALQLDGVYNSNFVNENYKGVGAGGSLTIVGVADNGSGYARLQVTSNYPGPHASSCTTTCYTNDISVGDIVKITGATPTDLNGEHVITAKPDGNHIDLDLSYGGPYSGTIYGGVRGKDSAIYLTGTTYGLNFTNQSCQGDSAGAVYPSTYCVEGSSTAVLSNIRFNGGYSPLGSTWGSSGVTVNFDNFISGSYPTNYIRDVPTWPLFSNITGRKSHATTTTSYDWSGETLPFKIPNCTTAGLPSAEESSLCYDTTTHTFKGASGASPTWSSFASLGGTSGQFQYNNSGAMAGTALLTVSGGALVVNSNVTQTGNLNQTGVTTITGSIRMTPVEDAISVSTFTPDFNASNHHIITLDHAACPCTLANPTNVAAGQSGIIVVKQSSSGSDTIGSYGSYYKFAGGSPTTLTTGADAIDVYSYSVVDSTHIIMNPSKDYR